MTTFVINVNANERYAVNSRNKHEAYYLCNKAGYSFKKSMFQNAITIGSGTIRIHLEPEPDMTPSDLLSILKDWHSIDIIYRQLTNHLHVTKGVLMTLTRKNFDVLIDEGWLVNIEPGVYRINT